MTLRKTAPVEKGDPTGGESCLETFLVEAENWLAEHADETEPGAVRLLSLCRAARAEYVESISAPLQCCELDTDGDGNCPIHFSHGVLRRTPVAGR